MEQLTAATLSLCRSARERGEASIVLVLRDKLLLQPVREWNGRAGDREFPTALVERLRADANARRREGVFVAQATEDRVDVFLVPYDKLPAIDTESDGLISSTGAGEAEMRRADDPSDGLIASAATGEAEMRRTDEPSDGRASLGGGADDRDAPDRDCDAPDRDAPDRGGA